MKVEERNKNAQYIVNAKIEYTKKLTESDFSTIKNKADIDNILKDLIEVNAKGFRGVVLTALVGMQLDYQYNPLKNFYDCNPRSIFEQGIWYSLTDHNIPCGKSDPLNVAKNIQELNESWAEGRRPQSAALAAVHFLREIVNTKSTEERALLENYFYFKLVKYSESISIIKIKEIAENTYSKQEAALKLSSFSLMNPESGALPQLLIGKIIKTLFSSACLIIYGDLEQKQIAVCGDDESVFGTNTTSKKPADIWVEYDKKPILLFEITVKKIDLKRLDDCLETLKGFPYLPNLPVTFICRYPEDVASIPQFDITKNYFIYKNKSFDFLDLSAFVTAFLISNSYLLGYTILQSTDTQDSLNECPLLFSFVKKKRCT